MIFIVGSNVHHQSGKCRIANPIRKVAGSINHLGHLNLSQCLKCLKINIHFTSVHAHAHRHTCSCACTVYTGRHWGRQSQPLQVCGFQQLQGDVLLPRLSIPRRLSNLCATFSVPGISQNVRKPVQPSFEGSLFCLTSRIGKSLNVDLLIGHTHLPPHFRGQRQEEGRRTGQTKISSFFPFFFPSLLPL